MQVLFTLGTPTERGCAPRLAATYIYVGLRLAMFR